MTFLRVALVERTMPHTDPRPHSMHELGREGKAMCGYAELEACLGLEEQDRIDVIDE